MKPKTDTAKNARCAELMGYTKTPVVEFSTNTRNWMTCERDEAGFLKEIPVKDYSPVTKIEQAMDFAFKQGVYLTFYPQTDGSIQLSVDGGKSMRCESLSDCARKIVETILEVENG